MKRKTIYEAMKTHVETTLNGLTAELISIGEDTSTDKETGEITSFIKAEAEVPRGHDAFSRCRFTVKIIDGKLKVTETQLLETDYFVKFKGLEISYIDTKVNFYFRASDYEVHADN